MEASKKYFFSEKRVKIPIWLSEIIFINSNDDQLLYDEWDLDFKGRMPRASFFNYHKDVEEEGVKFQKEMFVMVLNTEHPIDAPSYGTLVHECIHAAGAILDSRGVLADWNNDEALAYLVQWIFNQGSKFYFGFTDKKAEE